jgi:hypothetical protein
LERPLDLLEYQERCFVSDGTAWEQARSNCMRLAVY